MKNKPRTIEQKKRANERMRQYYAIHREQRLKYQKAYRSTHKEKIAADQRNFYKLHREEQRAKGNARARVYYAAHKEECRGRDRKRYSNLSEQKKEKIRQYGRIRYENHREEMKIKHKNYYKNHHREQCAYRRAYNLAHPDKARAHRIKRSYGLTLSDFNELLANQGGACAICGKSNWLGHGPIVDHDHVTGMIRGILCLGCNTAVGFIKDDLKTARALVGYLEKNNTESAKIS